MHLRKLINLCKKQDRKAQEELFRLYEDKLYTICLKYSRTKTEAEDNLQDSFISIFQKIDSYTFKGSFEGWMTRVTLNTVLQKYREKGGFRLINTDLHQEIIQVPLEAEDLDLDELLLLIQELPNQYRITFNLYVLDGYSHREISKLLQISEGTSKSNLARAKAILRRRITEIQELKTLKTSLHQ